MANFYIKRITAVGTGKKDASIEFSQGLNIICGLSDTGKSCVLLCIDFLFGGGDLPFDEANTGYSKVRMLIETPNGNITLERELGKNKIIVSSEVNGIPSGKYDCKYNAISKNQTISSLFLWLIGIKEEHQIIKNKDFVSNRLTWQTFSHMFVIEEERVHRKDSILLPDRKEANTLFFSSLLFLMTAQDFAGFDKREEKRIRDAKKGEIINRIRAELGDLAKRKETLDEQLTLRGEIDLTAQVHAIIAEVSAIKERIEQANERSKRLLGEIMDVREGLTSCDLQLDRYNSLRKHFIADIKRLSLIVDGETLLENVPHIEKCPFCDGNISDDEQPSYLETARSELTRIMSQLNGLSDTESDVQNRRMGLENRLNELMEEKSDIDSLVNGRLKPKERELAGILNDYNIVIRIQGEVNFIQRFSDEKVRELRDKETEEESKLEYLPREHFDSEFRETIDRYLHDAFVKCRFENFLSAHFSMDKFDVSINGCNKATTRGKGYRAFINTVLALTFRKYLIDKGKHNPELFVVDSPLLTLKQGVDDQAPESMRTALFSYLLEAQDDGQVIVIENEIPDLDYGSYGVEPIRFTGGKTPGRYGFLYLEGQY